MLQGSTFQVSGFRLGSSFEAQGFRLKFSAVLVFSSQDAGVWVQAFAYGGVYSNQASG